MKSRLQKYLYHWPLFLISLAFSIAGLYFYFKMTNPVHEIRASFFMQDEKKDVGEKSPLHEIDLVSSFRILENELEILRSKQLIGKVIADLGLTVSYRKKEGLSSTDLYKSGPVKFTLLKASGDYEKARLKVFIKDRNSFTLEVEDGKFKTFSFGKNLVNRFGTWKLEPTNVLEAYRDAEIDITIFEPNKLALQYQKRIHAELPSKLSTTVLLSMSDESPERGIDILDRLMYNYNLAGTIAKNRETKSTLDFIDNRLASLTGELNDAEKGIEEFKSSRGLTNISSDSEVSLSNLQANDAQLNEINLKLGVIEGIEKYVSSPKSFGNAPATLGIQDPALTSLIEKLSMLQLQRENLLGTTPEGNPAFEPLNRQIANAKAAIKENVASIKSSLENTRMKLQSFNNRFESSVKNIPVQERQYINIKRQQSIKESLYTYLLQKREETAVSYAAALSNDRVVDQPYAIPPKGFMQYLVVMAALVFSVAFPVGIVFIRNFFSVKITDLQEIEDTLDIPVLGELPYQSSRDRIAVNDIHTSVLGEQFRALRIKLFYLLGEKDKARVTLITSGLPGEGKSFVSSNLGLTLAFSSRKTIVLELDMRKPKMAATFGLAPESAGMSEFLSGTATVEDIIQRTELDSNLDFISSGAVVRNPSELLEKKRLRDLIQHLQCAYDDIVIDSPPVRLVPDAMILSHLTDVTLYVVRQGLTEKDELDFLSKLNTKKQLSNIQIVFNGVQWTKYGYGYNYNSAYYTQGKNESIFSDFWHRF